MNFLATAIGVLATVFYLLSYQLKKRKNIIVSNSASKILYIIQYIMLGAFEGAALDIMGTVSAVSAHSKDKGFVKKHTKLVFAIVNIAIIAVGLAFYKNIFSLFPIAGVLLQTNAFWINNEKTIRIVSFLGCPCWLTYNLVSLAYGSALGDTLTMVSILTAIYRYDIKGRAK